VGELGARHQPLDHALSHAETEIGHGHVLLTIPTDDTCEDIADRAAKTSGGRQIFSA
jgi:hypothetical protein